MELYKHNSNQLHKLSAVIWLALLCVAASAESLPDAPSQKHRSFDWKLVTASSILVGSDIFDQETTLRGLASPKGCYEKNGGDPYPSRAKLYAKNLPIDAGLITFGWAMKRLKIPIAPYAGMGVVSFKHIHGGVEWYTRGCL